MKLCLVSEDSVFVCKCGCGQEMIFGFDHAQAGRSSHDDSGVSLDDASSVRGPSAKERKKLRQQQLNKNKKLLGPGGRGKSFVAPHLAVGHSGVGLINYTHQPGPGFVGQGNTAYGGLGHAEGGGQQYGVVRAVPGVPLAPIKNSAAPGQFVQGGSFFPDAPVGNVSSALVKQHVQADLQRPPPPFVPGGSALLPQHHMAQQPGHTHQHHLGPVPGVWDVGSSGAVTFSLGGNLNSSNPGFVVPNGHGAQDPRHHSRGGVGPTQRPAKGDPSHPYQRPY